MKILIMGTGGVGGYYGGLLAQQRHEVIFVARGDHLRAMQTQGLQIKSTFGDFTINPVHATADPAKIGPVDLVIFCVKTYDTDSAAKAILPVVGPQTTVLSLQNGIEAADRVGAVIGHQHMIGGATWLSAAVEAPGVIRQVSQFRRVVLGELAGGTSERIDRLQPVLENTGITAEKSADILKVLWTKFVFISSVSCVGSLTRLPMGDYRHVPEARALLSGIMHEVEALARAQDIHLEADVVEQSLAFIDKSAPTITPSMQRDIESGHISEIESLIGAIGRKGRELGVPTPAADFTYAALLPVDLKARAQP